MYTIGELKCLLKLLFQSKANLKAKTMFYYFKVKWGVAGEEACYNGEIQLSELYFTKINSGYL